MSTSNGVLNNPQTTIGAQDILAVGRCSKTGFLRKEGRIERVFKFMKWRQRFIVLSRVCIYIFEDELASSPKASFSLKLFIKCERNRMNETIWPFRVISADGSGGKNLQFSCMSEPDRKIWMQHIKQEMVLAHKLPPSVLKDDGENYDDYVYLEKPIPRKPPPPPPVDTSDTDDDDPGGEADYTTIDEEMMSELAGQMADATPKKMSIKSSKAPMVRKMPLTLPANGNKMPSSTGKKKSSTLPEPSANVVSRKAFEYNGSDRSEIERLLVARPEGTYLVRKSRSDGKEVLSINVEGVLKEFKIYVKDDQVTINNDDYFDTVEELIQYYRENVLPNKSTKLYLAYSVTDPRYKNQ